MTGIVKLDCLDRTDRDRQTAKDWAKRYKSRKRLARLSRSYAGRDHQVQLDVDQACAEMLPPFEQNTGSQEQTVSCLFRPIFGASSCAAKASPEGNQGQVSCSERRMPRTDLRLIPGIIPAIDLTHKLRVLRQALRRAYARCQRIASNSRLFLSFTMWRKRRDGFAKGGKS